MLKKFFTAWRFHLQALLATILLVMTQAPYAIAATWQWQGTTNGERVTINLDDNIGRIQAKRSGTHTVFLPIVLQNLLLSGQGPDSDKLTRNIDVDATGLNLQLQNSAFGYFLRQPSAKQVIIDIFSDPLGARWQADGKLAPQGTKGIKDTDKAESKAIAPTVTNIPTQNIAAPLQEQESIPNVKTNNAVPTLPPKDLISPNNNSDSIVPIEQPSSMDVLPYSMPPESAPSDLHKDLDNTDLPLHDANGTLQNDASNPIIPSPTSSSELPATSVESQILGPKSVLVAAADPKMLNERLNGVTKQDEQIAKEVIEEDADSDTARGKALGAQEVVGSINTSGPDSWPKEAGINTTLPTNLTQKVLPQDTNSTDAASSANANSEVVTDQSTSTATDPVAAGTSNDAQTNNSSPVPQVSAGADNNLPKQANISNSDVRQGVNTEGRPQAPVEEVEPRPVIYMDEEGNVVDKPPDPNELFAQAEKLIYESKYTEAVPILEQLRAMPSITREMREQVLYNLSDALFAIYEGKPLEGFEPIISSTSEAMNVNLRSSRVPDALYRLGLMNAYVGNFVEAEGYFKALKRRYPNDINIPTAFYQLGKEQFDKGLFAEAEKNFRMVVNEYPDAPALDEATTALVKALTRLKEFKEAQVYADFAGKRWARYYVEDPGYINYLAEIEYNLANKEGALQHYWLLYNLDPTHERSAEVLAKIGDLYFETGRPSAALETFAEIEERFPKSDAAALAYLRRSERGIYDSPINMAAMFDVFENPGTPLPQVAYKTLQKNRPSDKRSITSQLKYALWQLWNREYTDAMGSAGDFIDLHPEHLDVELAKEIIMRGFMADLKNSLAEENYGRVLILWNGFPIVRERYGPIDSELRNALGRGFLERGEDENAMEMLAEFLKTPMDPRYSESTFALYFNKYLESGNWNAMLDLGELVKDWQMSPSMRGQLDYAMALSAENLGLRDRALKLWKPLSENQNLQLYQRAYATYFLAKDAEERQDIREAYTYNLKTLELFEALREERSDRADTERIKEAIGALMDITEVSNRIPEALEWVERYNEFAPEGSPEYPGLRFREARLYRKLGNDERARLLLEIIVNNYADSPFAAAAGTELSTFELSRDLRNFLPGQGG